MDFKLCGHKYCLESCCAEDNNGSLCPDWQSYCSSLGTACRQQFCDGKDNKEKMKFHLGWKSGSFYIMDPLYQK